MSNLTLTGSVIDLLKKYNLPGPRYTSYPTAPEWQDDFLHEQYVKQLQALTKKKGPIPLSLYFHIPFCEERCYYCGCYTMVDKKRIRVNKYLRHLFQEIELFKEYLPDDNIISQLHWGGGTPTYLDEQQIESLFELINKHFTLDKESEVAIEIDPCVTPKSKLKVLRDVGFNRASIGVQDFNPAVQKAVNRVQGEEMTIDLIEYARTIGFESINMDFIYGLPLQTVQSFSETIARVIKVVSPDRVALFSYARVPWVSPHQKKIKEKDLPNTDEKFAIFLEARRLFLEAGYVAIGMDHFAKPEDEIAIALKEKTLHRNFMGYTVRSTEDFIGFGASSIGYVNQTYIQNIKILNQYYNTIEDKELPVHRGLELNKDDLMRQWTISTLMCHFELDYKKFEERFNQKFSEYFSKELKNLDTFKEDDFLEITKEKIQIKEQGTLFIRNIAMEFDKYLKKKEREGRFSQTV